MKLVSASLSAILVASISLLPACDKKEPAPTPPKTTDKHDSHDGHDHGPGGAHADEHASMIDLGTAAIGAFEVKASRDSGAIVAGKDAAIDAVVKPAAGAADKIAAVRFWIGTEDAKGSVKARADIEDPKHPDHWHTHAEVPSPLPAGSKVWIEIETDKGVRSAAGFDLKG